MSEFIDRTEDLRRDSAALRVIERPPEPAGSLEIVVLCTDTERTAGLVEKAAALANGLNVTLRLVAVYVSPYPADLRCPVAIEEHVTARLTRLAEQTGLPSVVHFVVARDRDAGFRSALRPASVVLLASARRWWHTREEKLARDLTRQGHHVSLLHFA